MELQNRFYKLAFKYSDDEKLISNLWNELHKKYSEKHRTYHNLTHISELFNYLDIYKEQIYNPANIEFSILYHDIIYGVFKKDNEEKSADFAKKNLAKLNLTIADLNTIHQQIMATKTHFATDNDTKWFVDFDLGILGKSEDIYKKYAKLIREEYKLVPNFM